jgi:uncharacterized protein YndB with AHSA1/START domain
MARMEGSVVINRPVDEVFAYVADVRNWPQWNSSMQEGEQTSTGPVGVGTTCQGVSQFLGRRMEWTSEITEYEPNRKMGQKITSGPMSIEQSLTLVPVEDGTRFTLVGEGEMGGFFKLADPIVNRAMQRQMEGNLANLKDILEAQA